MVSNREGQSSTVGDHSNWGALLRPAGLTGKDRDDEPSIAATSTGTTIVGIRAADAVVMGADRRASLGGQIVTSKQFNKLERIHPRALLAIAGTVGGNQRFARLLRAETAMYRHRRDELMSMRGLSTVAGNILAQHAFRAMPIIGGVDAAGPHLVSLDGAGGVLQHEYTANGSGMQFAHGVLEQRCRSEPSVEEAKRVLAQSIESAVERDTASGNGLQRATITSDGVEFETYDSPSEAT